MDYPRPVRVYNDHPWALANEGFISRTPILGGPGLMLAIKMVVGKLGQ